MVKPEWGSKRTCPKCSTRFYDLGSDDPVTCIECGTEFIPEPVLKSKQPLPFDEEEKKKKDEDLAADDLEDVEDDDGGSADDDVDLDTGDDDIKVVKSDDDDGDDN